VALDADGRLISLSPSSAVAELLGIARDPHDGDYLARGALGALQVLFARSNESETFEDFAAADAGAIYLTAREREAEHARLLRLEPDGRVAWQREVPYWTDALAADQAGGVWVTGSEHYRDREATTTQRSHARVLHYDRGGRPLGELTLRGARAPRPSSAATRSVQQLVVDGRGQLWMLGHYQDSLSLGSAKLYAPRFGGERFVAVVGPALVPLGARPVESDAEIRRVGERVLLAHGEPQEACLAHFLDIR
jgi:hypothetical protein